MAKLNTKGGKRCSATASRGKLRKFFSCETLQGAYDVLHYLRYMGGKHKDQRRVSRKGFFFTFHLQFMKFDTR